MCNLTILRNKQTNELYGYFYLDLFSRDGKYAHQCVFPIVPSFRTEENVKVITSIFNSY